VLEREGLMEKKGFPESYDLPALLRFLADVKAGPAAGARTDLLASRLRRDAEPVGRGRPPRHPDRRRTERVADRQLPKDGKAIPYVSDFFDFSVYHRRRGGRAAQVVRRPLSHAARHRVPRSEVILPSLFEARRREAVETATSIWQRINLINLRENILPTRQRAHLILKKDASHLVHAGGAEEAVASFRGATKSRARNP
jgi:type I pantothenate kinase